MNLQQFRFLREAARHKFSLTEAARALHTSQPGISKAIIDLEEELGVPILARHGKRVKGLTAPGQQVLEAAERIMRDVDNLKKLARDYAGSPEGTLRVATTHTQARYVLPGVVQAFALKFPQVRLKLLQANPPQIASMLVHGQADLGVATESLADFPGLLSIPVYERIMRDVDNLKKLARDYRFRSTTGSTSPSSSPAIRWRSSPRRPAS
jgi:LysR family transcriptional regulator, cys regulon transcriptional activator